MKRFLEWIGVKKRLDEHDIRPPFISEGDFWWCAFGENIGTEIDGKSADFTRPVIIIKKFGPLSFLGIPTTTREKSGSWYVSFVHHGIRETAVLSQVRTLSYKRLHTKIGTLNDLDFKKVKEALSCLLTNVPPSQEVAGKSRM